MKSNHILRKQLFEILSIFIRRLYQADKMISHTTNKRKHDDMFRETKRILPLL
jgi:hypothetical protein